MTFRLKSSSAPALPTAFGETIPITRVFDSSPFMRRSRFTPCASVSDGVPLESELATRCFGSGSARMPIMTRWWHASDVTSNHAFQGRRSQALLARAVERGR